MTRDRDFLADIVELIDTIERHRPGGLAEFESDEVLSTAVLHWIQTIGEAAGKASTQLRDDHPDVPWRQIIGMRNLVAHGYREVDLRIVWQVLDRDLAPLRLQIETILASLPDE